MDAVAFGASSFLRHSLFGFRARPFCFANVGRLSYIESDETKSDHLYRRHFLVVFLGATCLGGIAKALRGSRRFRMENRPDGRFGFSEIGRASGMVLSAERDDDAFTVYAQTGMVRAESSGGLAPNLVAEAARDLGVTDDRVRMALANATEREGQPDERLESFGGNRRGGRRSRSGKAARASAFPGN